MALPKNKEEMIERGMVPLGQPGNEERDAAVRAKTKGVSSEKASISQKVLRIKDGTTKDVDKAIMELVRNPEASAVQITKISNKILERFEEMSTKNQIALFKVLNDRYKTLFGGKLSVDADIKMNTTDVILNRLAAWKQEEAGKTPTEYKAPTQDGEVPLTESGNRYKDDEALATWKKAQAPQESEVEEGYEEVNPEVART